MESSLDPEKVHDMLRPFYQFLEMGSEHLGLLVLIEENSRKFHLKLSCTVFSVCLLHTLAFSK